MSFLEILDQLVEQLSRRKRLTYRSIQIEYGLDDALLEAIKEELIFGQRIASDENGKVLVWIGEPHPQPVEHSAVTPQPKAPPTVSVSEESPAAYTPSYLARKILESRSALEGERKQLTVLFADIKGSTELNLGLDPEETDRLLLDPTQKLMIEAVHRYEGTVNQIMGDGIMALFGAPIAHEDHAARACYAALDIKAGMQKRAAALLESSGVPLQVRIGLNSGEVVVRAIGNDLRMDWTAVGQPTNLAARMEQLADPDTIFLTSNTLRLAEGMVEVRSRGPMPVKGLPEPVEIFELVAAAPHRRRLQGGALRGFSRFVGRDLELETFRRILDLAKLGEGQIVAIVGEAGVGKSRLVHELVHSPISAGCRILESASVSYGDVKAYFPVVDLLKQYFQIRNNDPEEIIRTKIKECLATNDDLRGTVPPLLALLEVLPAEEAFHSLDVRQRQKQMLDALRQLFLDESRKQPLLLVFEDLHSIDNGTQEVLDSLVRSLPRAQILLVVTYRPEYRHDWSNKTYYTRLRLDRLETDDSLQLLSSLLGEDPSLDGLKGFLIDRTGGNPFFLEESVRSLEESDLLEGHRGAYRLTEDVSTAPIPDSVQAILAARMDRLAPEEKHLLQTAAVIGKEVPIGLLKSLAKVPEEQLYPYLDRLESTEFLYETHIYPEQIFTFKHALTHEVAYGTLLREQRRHLHSEIVKLLEASVESEHDIQPERLAPHALRGELWGKALTYFHRAGTKAITRSAFREAVACFEQGLEARRRLPDHRETLVQTLDLYLELRNARFAIGDLEKVHDCLQEAQAIAEALGDHMRLGRVLNFMSAYYSLVGDPHAAIRTGNRARSLTADDDDIAPKVRANYYLGIAYHNVGQYQDAIRVLTEAISLIGDRFQHERFGTTTLPAVVCRLWLVYCLAQLGEFSQGVTYGEEGVQIAEEYNHPYSLAYMHCSLGFLLFLQGRHEECITHLESGLKVCRAADIPVLFPLIAHNLGCAYALAGRSDEAEPLLEHSKKLAQVGRRSAQSLREGCLGEVYLRRGQIKEAGVQARLALDLARQHHEVGHHAWALKLAGQVATRMSAPPYEEGRQYFEEARSMSDKLRMLPLKAHCYFALGNLFCKTGQLEAAENNFSLAIELYRRTNMALWVDKAEKERQHI